MADFIDEIIEREGGDKLVDDPCDTGGRTIYGICERANPDLWRHGPPTREQARARYLERYVTTPGFDKVAFEPLRLQLIDFGVNAGPARAISLLQHILHVDRDGRLGPVTLAALRDRNPVDVNNLLVGLRETYYRDLVRNRPTNAKFLKGWLKRAHHFWIEVP